MFSIDNALYLQRKLYLNQEVNPFVFYFLFSTNKHWVVEVCKNEFNNPQVLRDIEAEYLYCIGLNALEKAILEFNVEEDDIENYYYNYIKEYLENEIDGYLEEFSLLYTSKDYDFMWNLDEKYEFFYNIDHDELLEKVFYQCDIYAAYQELMKREHSDSYYINILKEELYGKE